MSKIHKWLYEGDTPSRFLMLPPELYQAPQWQALKPAAREFYIFLNTYRETEQQRACLFQVLTAYNKAQGLGLSDFDIENESRPKRGSKYINGYFVCPIEHLKEYGYKPDYVKKLKKQLMTAGFIERKYYGIGRELGFKNNITVYQFVSTWKKGKVL